MIALRLLAAAVLLALVATSAASSADAKRGRLEAAQADLPAVVTGTVGRSDFHKTVSLQAVGGAIDEIRYRASDLVGVEDATRKIARTDVKVDGLKMLEPDEFIDVTITVSNVSRKGSYTGTLALYAKGNYSQRLELPLTVVASPRVPFSNESEDRIEVDPDDLPLLIEARLGDETSFTESIVLNSTGNTISGVQIIPSRLKTDDGKITLPRTSIEMSGASEVPADMYVSATIKVKGVTKAGLYLGSFVLVPGGQSRANGTFVPLSVNVRGIPSLTPVSGSGSEQLTMKVTRCRLCGADRLVVSDAGDRPKTLQFDQPERVDVVVGKPQLLVQGEKHGKHVTSDQIKITTGKDGRIVEVRAEATALKLPPDRYTGTLRLPIEDAATPLNVPVTVTVRDGPLYAFLALVLGLLIARILRAQNRWSERMKALDAIEEVRARASAEIPADVTRVGPRLAQLETAARQGRTAVAADGVKAVNARIDVLAETRKIQGGFPDLADSLEHVRDLIEGEQDTAAKDALAALKTEIAGRDAPQKELALGAVATAIAGSESAVSHVQGAASRWTDKSRVLVRRVVYFLSGVEDWTAARAQRNLYVLGRILAGMVAFAVVAFIALKTLYVNGSETFGADGLYDYIALVIGGMTAEVTQRATANAASSGAP